MKANLRQQRKTARVFFSSPFGGLEEEREELTKKYWPKLSSICKRAGYEFVPVDMRWGITSEMSSNAATIEICLREMDRSDMIVGFFGQRYGWHGFDALLQKSFDVAAVKYPWLNDYREKAVTELEFLHGHLRNPGKRAACFFFRDKSYDDMKLKLAEEAGEEGKARKFRSSADGPKAAEYLADLKERVYKTQDKCLAVHMSYKNPQEGARLMYETIEKYLKDVFLARPVKKVSPLEEERSLHDVFMVSRLSMGGVYVGGESYMNQIDSHVKSQSEEDIPKHLVVIGEAGSGKSCLLGNWSLHHQEKFPNDAVVYHFAGCTSGSTVPLKILKRLVEELRGLLKEKTGEEQPTVESDSDSIRDLIRELTDTVKRITDAGHRTVIIIDALNKVDEAGQTTKTLFWLPRKLPRTVHLIVSVNATDLNKVVELTEERGYSAIHTSPLKEAEREEVALATLKVRGKALSSEQKVKVVTKAQTENPLYLKTLLEELCGFGEFFQLDAYLDNLLEAKDTKELFLKFLKRLEEDYNPKEYEGNLIKDVSLSETELKNILKITDQIWSVLYFTIEEFILERSGLYGFSYDELSAAVKERYCEDESTIKHYLMLLIEYFDAILKERSAEYYTEIPDRVKMELPWLLVKAGEKERLIKCLTTASIFWSLNSAESKYDLINYWNSTGLTGEDINDLYKTSVDDQLAVLYVKEQEKFGEPTNALKVLFPFVYGISQFQSDAGNMTEVEPFLQRAIDVLKTAHSEEEIHSNSVVAEQYCNMVNSLACLFVDTEQFDKAEPLHLEVLELREKFADTWINGWSSVASSLNGLGVLYYRTNRFEEALTYYNRCLELHRKTLPATHSLIPDTLNNIGALYKSMARWEDSAKVLEEALQLYEDAYFGQLPPAVGGTFLNLGMAYFRLYDASKAEPLYLKRIIRLTPIISGDFIAIEIKWKPINARNSVMTSSYACPPIQTVRENLRDCLEGDGGIQVMQLAFVLAKNEPAYVEAANGVVPQHANGCNIVEPTMLGVVGNGVQADVTMLAPVVYCGEDTTHKTLETTFNARAWLQQCWKSCENGSNIVALRLGDHRTKEMLGVVGALDIRTKAYGPDHLDVGQTLLTYSAFLLSVDASKSADAAIKAVEIFEKSLGPEHINTLNAQENVALAFAKDAKFDKAHPYFKKSGIIRHQRGQMNSSIPILNAAMADYYLNNGHNEEARQLFERLVGNDFATDRDFAALDFLDHELLGDDKPERPYNETVDFGLEKFPSSVMLFGRKLPKLAEKGDSKSTIHILEKGDFGVEKYNESYQSFVESQHRREGLEILTAAHEKFPTDTIILQNVASCYAFYKDYSKASVYFGKLVDLQPDNEGVTADYGRVLAMSGKVDEAKEQLRNALKIAEKKNQEQLVEQFKSYLNLLEEM